MEKQFIKNDIMSLKGVLIKELKDGFKVSGSLDLTDSLLEKLPNNMLIYDDLIIGNSKIKELPSGLKIGRNLILGDAPLGIPSDIVVGGKIILQHTEIEPPFQKDNMVITDDNKKVAFRERKVCYHENIMEDDYYYPEVYYYYGINLKRSAVEFTENNKTYIFSCRSPREGFKKIDWQRAENFGIHKYDNYNIDEFRTVNELKEIYQTCTGACDSGIERFKEIFNIDNNKLYTIRQLAKMVEELDWVRGSVIVFFEFFGLEHSKIKKVIEEESL